MPKGKHRNAPSSGLRRKQGDQTVGILEDTDEEQQMICRESYQDARIGLMFMPVPACPERTDTVNNH